MRKALNFETPNLIRAGLVVMAVAFSLMTGISILIFGDPLSPLFIAGGVLAAVLAVVFLLNPIWAVCAAIFIGLLPYEILNYNPIPVIHDYPVLFCLLFACVSWLLSVIIYHQKIVWNNAILLMLVFLVWCVITLFWAPDLLLGRRQFMAYFIGLILLILLVNNINSPRTLNTLMTTLALNGWVLVLAGVGTILIEGYRFDSRLEVLGLNENEMGTLTLLMMIGVLWSVVQPSSPYRQIKRLFSLIFLLMTITLVAASGSRGSAISLLITFIAFCLWKPTRAWGLLGLISLMLGFFLTPVIFSTTLARFDISQGDTLLGGREALWQATWNLILDHPWLGVGIGNSRHALTPYAILLRSIGGKESAATHNPILQVWAEIGLPGILLYLGVLGSAALLYVRHYFIGPRFGMHMLVPYFALVSSTSFGYMASWIKGGGMESNFSYYLMLSLLMIPASLILMDKEKQRNSINDLEATHYIATSQISDQKFAR